MNILIGYDITQFMIQLCNPNKRVEYFAFLLISQIPVRLARKAGFHGPDMLKIIDALSSEWKKASKEKEKLSEELRKNNQYFYPESGSVFVDYKELRDSQPSGSFDNVVSKFSLNMTYEQLLETARGVIAEWQAEPGIERK